MSHHFTGRNQCHEPFQKRLDHFEWGFGLTNVSIFELPMV
jgi:hypothetical protein